IIWKQTGKISEDQLNQVIAAQKAISNVPDQYWASKNYAFDFPLSEKPADNKRVQLNNTLKRSNSETKSTLESTVQTLLDIRKPFVPLVAFGWSGGFGKRDTQLTVLPDGRMIYEDQMRQTTVADKMTQPDMDLVQQLISNPGFKSYPPVVKQSCADCW